MTEKRTEHEQMPLQRRVFLGEIKAVETDDSMVTATVSTDEVDRYNEVILPTAFKKNMKKFMRNPVILYAHQYGSRYKVFPIGKAVKTPEIVEHGLKMDIKFATEIPEHEDARIVAGLMRNGYLNAFSVGFIPIKWQTGNPEKGQPMRTYDEVELLEVSVVPVPAASGAVVEGRSLDDAVEEGILPVERLDEFRPVRDAEDLVKVLQKESLLPQEDEKYVRIPLLRASEYNQATARSFLYRTDDRVQCVVARRNSDGEEVPVRFVFDKSKRWDSGKAQKWVEVLRDEEWSVILDNLSLTKDMDVMAGRDLFQAIEYDQARKQVEEVEVVEEKEDRYGEKQLELALGQIEIEEKPGWDESANEWRYRLREPDLFVEGSFRRMTIQKPPKKPVYGIIGRLKSNKRWKMQALRFPKADWTLPEAKAWYNDHKDGFKEFNEEYGPYETVREILQDVDSGTLDDGIARHIMAELVSEKGTVAVRMYEKQVVTREGDIFRKQTMGYLKALSRIAEIVGIETDDLGEMTDLVVERCLCLLEEKGDDTKNELICTEEEKGIEAREVERVLVEDSQSIRVDDLGALEKILKRWMDKNLDPAVDQKINRARGLIEFPME